MSGLPTQSSGTRGCRARAGSRGFTLIELVVVMVIVGVVSAIAIPRFGALTNNYRSRLGATRIVADLAQARSYALATSSTQSVVFDVAGGSYEVSGVAHLNDSAAAYSVLMADPPYRSTLLSADFGGDATVKFDGFGVPDSGGTVVVAAGGISVTVVLDANTGEAAIQ